MYIGPNNLIHDIKIMGYNSLKLKKEKIKLIRRHNGY